MSLEDKARQLQLLYAATRVKLAELRRARLKIVSEFEKKAALLRIESDKRRLSGI